jgi:hypothetical protein
VVYNLTRNAINQECGISKCFIPVFKWHVGNFNNVSMLPFGSSILLMGMRTRNKVRNSNLMNKDNLVSHTHHPSQSA